MFLRELMLEELARGLRFIRDGHKLALELLRPESLDETYFRLLPSGSIEVAAEEAAMLAAMFGENGELPARRLS